MRQCFYLILTLSLLNSCASPNTSTKVPDDTASDSTLARLTLKKDTLTAVLSNDITSYFIYRGEPRGFEYEMLHLFAEENNLQLDIEVVPEIRDVLHTLRSKHVDVAAANLTITEERKKDLEFTHPLIRTRQVLVQRDTKDSVVTDPLNLENQTIHVPPQTSYYQRLVNFRNESGIFFFIDTTLAETSTETSIRLVSEGELDYTISDENLAKIHSRFFNDLNIETAISLNQNIAWAVNKENDSLLTLLNAFLNEFQGSRDYNIIYKRYFGGRTFSERRMNKEYPSVSEGQISIYDKIFQESAKEIAWNWQLLAAQCRKESHFNPEAKSRYGALGLMQIMPATAKSYIDSSSSLTDPATNIKVAVEYLKYLNQELEGTVPDKEERIKFVLAAYNVGLGHIYDAQRLADKYDLDPAVWTDNVGLMLLNKSEPKYYKDEVVRHGYARGYEPYYYVQDIMHYYDLYKEFTQ